MTTKTINLQEDMQQSNNSQEQNSQKTKDAHHPSIIETLNGKLIANLTKIINKIKAMPHERKALIFLGVGVIYFFLGVFSIHFNLSMMMILGSIGFILFTKIKNAKKSGIINKLSPGLRTLLMKRSIFDILCDLWYFPIIPKYIKAILGPFIFKKDPEVTIKNFDELHPKFKQLVLTKGMINVLPTPIKNFLLPDNILDINSDHIQDSDDSGQGNEGGNQISGSHQNLSTRDNSDTNSNNGSPSTNVPYIKERNFVHEAIEELNKDVIHKNKQQHQNSQHIPGTTELVICSQDVQNQIKREKLLKYLQGNIQDKYYKANHYHHVKANKEKNSTFSQDPRVFLLKFLQGSKNVSERDRKTLKKALFVASIILGTQLYFSKQSRQWLKYTILFMVYITAAAVSTGSFVLLSKHKKASNKSQQQTLQEEI